MRQLRQLILGLAAGALLAQGLPADPIPLRTTPLWSFRIPDAQPAQYGMVDAGQLYASSYNGHVYQFDLKSGALRNDWNVSSPYRAYSAPRMVDGQLYVYTGDKCFYRLDKSPAKAVRLANFSSDNKNQIRVEALAYDPETGLFFLGTGENVHAVNTNGVKQWTLPHPNKDWAEPMSCDGMLYLFDTTTRKVYKYDPVNPGNALWSVDFAASTSYLSKGVDGDGDTMIYAVAWQYTTTGTGRLAAIYDSGPLAGTKKWDIPLNHAIKHVSLWEGKDILVIPAMNDKVVFRRASTGEFLRETTLSGGVDGISQSPWSQVVISGDYGIVTTHDSNPENDKNYLFVLDLNTGAELWKSDHFWGGVGCMLPILSDGIAVIGTYCDTSTWYAYELGTGGPTSFLGFGNPRNTGNVNGGLTSLSGRSLRTYHVSTTGSDVDNDGLSWETAFGSIRHAVAVALNGDEVVVASGTYLLTDPITIDKAITVRSVNGRDATIVDGQGSVRGFLINHRDAILDGFTIRNGLGSVVSGYGTAGFSVGGGVLLDGGLLANCSVLTNSAAEGGGVFFAGASSVVSNCLVQGNTATRSGGGLSNIGQTLGGKLFGNTIRGNSGWGGGVWIVNGLLENNVVAYNTDPANYSGGIRQVGGTNRNSLIYRNTATGSTGGGLYVSGNGLVENNTVAYNNGGTGGTTSRSSGLRADNTQDSNTIRNTVAFGNAYLADEVVLSASSTMTYSCWPAGTSGTGNLASDPLFVDAAADNYSLSASSPCLDAGANQGWMSTTLTTDAAGQTRIQNDRVDMGALEFNTPATFYVRTDGVDGANDGKSWGAAFCSIGYAVAKAVDGEGVVVSNGTYTVTDPIAIDKAINVRSVNGAGVTIVDGNNATRIFRIAHADAVVDGFTVRRGVGSVVTGFGTGGFSVGGGVLLDGGLLANCSVLTNSAAEGGGVFFAGSASVVSNCLVQGNTATRSGGGVSNVGQISGGRLFGNTIQGNSGWGGGVWIDYGHMENNVVAYNSDPANYSGGIRQRGGTNRNSLVYRNTAGGATGGGLYVSHHGLVENATVAHNNSGGNTADRSSGLRASDFNDTSVIRNTVVWGNTFGPSGSEVQPPPLGSVTYSCWPNGTFGTGNLASAPLFVDASADDFSTSAHSPGVDAGLNQDWMSTTLTTDAAGKPRINNGTVDMGALEFVPPATYFVSMNGTDGANDGKSWGAAFASINYAVAKTFDDDEVVVSNGTYTVSQQIVVNKAITLRSVNGASATVLDGGNAYNRVFFINHASAVVDGFTITRGVGSVVSGYGNAGYTVGGGVLLDGGLLANCSVLTNSAADGGGVFFAGSSSVVSNCLVQGNSATRYGGGLSNNADLSAGVYNGPKSNGKLFHNVIRNNSVGINGAGVWIDNGTMENNVVAFNAGSSGIRQRGGTNRNSLVYRNTVVPNANTGGGVYLSHHGLLENATIAYNHGGANTVSNPQRSGALRADDSNDASVIRNTVVWGNTCLQSQVLPPPNGSVTYTCWPNGTSGTGNINADPQYRNAEANDFRLKDSSPCINKGINQSWMTLATDVAGKPRIVQGIVDMGAFELPLPPVTLILLR